MKKVKKRSGNRGLPPGSFIQVNDEENRNTSLRVFTFDKEEWSEKTLKNLGECPVVDPTRTTWLDIDGLNTDETLQAVGKQFDLHPLLLEDVLNTEHRPKVEEYPDTLFIVAKMLTLGEENGNVQVEQICFVLRKGLVISFQERPGDILNPIRDRIRQNTGRVRRAGADYLVYALLDVIVDNYFVIVESLGERIEKLEQKVMLRPGNEDLFTMQELRSQLITIGRYVTPTRELAGRLHTMQSDVIDNSTRKYINDLQDHAVYIAETIGTHREMLTNLENSFHAMFNLRSGQVIKLLTITSTIFIPLTFIVGVYGMNFDRMPWLHSRFGFYGVMAFMIALSFGMLLWFRSKRWL